MARQRRKRGDFMNKQEWMNDLVNLQGQQKNIAGAINYIIGKIRELDRLESEAKETKEPKEEELEKK